MGIVSWYCMMVRGERIVSVRGDRVVRDREDREKKTVPSPLSTPLSPIKIMNIYTIKMNNYTGRLKNGNGERRVRFPHSPMKS